MKTLAFALLAGIAHSLSAAQLSTHELLDIARRHALPMPPSNARLVLAHTGGWSVLGNQSTSRDPGIYSPAFLLEENTNGIVILRGAERQTVERARSGEPLWRPFSVEKVEPKLGGHMVDFSNVSTFVCAVQLAARGDDNNCQRIWNRFASEEWWESDDFRDSFHREKTDPVLLLANCIFIQLRRELLRDQPDWPGILSRMKALFMEFGGLKTDERISLLNDLTATVEARPATAGSTEELVLQLARIAPRGRGEMLRRTILLQGRATVPALIALLNDRRLTALESPAVMNSPASILRVGELAHMLLRELTGLGWRADASAFRDWQARSEQLDESESLISSVFQRRNGKIESVNETAALALAQKYPEKLVALCETFSREADSGAQPHVLANAIATARLPLATRIGALVEFGSRGPLEHRRSVLQALAALDGHKCAELLAPILKTLSPDVPGQYWTCPEAALTHVVMRIEDDGLWSEYLRVAKRSSVGLRMEMMNPMCYTYIGNTNRGRRLAFLAALLDDATVRDKSTQPGKFEGPCAAFTIPKITVRDFAAEKIAAIMGFSEHPDEFWTETQWQDLRNKVRTKLAEANLPNLESPK